MLDRVVAADLEHVEEADQVALEVCARVLDGVADARLRGEVHNNVEAVIGEQTLDEGGVAQVAAHEGEAAVCVGLGQHTQAGILDAGVVVAVEVVETDNHIIGLLEQLLDEECADEASGARYQYITCHFSSFVVNVLNQKERLHPLEEVAGEAPQLVVAHT